MTTPWAYHFPILLKAREGIEAAIGGSSADTNWRLLYLTAGRSDNYTSLTSHVRNMFHVPGSGRIIGCRTCDGFPGHGPCLVPEDVLFARVCLVARGIETGCHSTCSTTSGFLPGVCCRLVGSPESW